MKINNQPDVSKYDYNPLFIAVFLLLVASQAAENIQIPAGEFIHGVALGMSIACSIIGLVMYGSAAHKQKVGNGGGA